MLRLSDLSRRQKTIGASVIGVVLLLAVVVTTWLELAVQTADEVEASWDLRCPHAKVTDHESQPAIRSKPGWRCDVRLTISNDSDHDVNVDHVRSPILGSGGGAEVRGYSTDGADLRSEHADGVDARWDVDVTVPAHSSRRLTLAVGWRARGCNAGGWLSIPDWPQVAFEALHRGFTTSPDQALVLRTYDDRHDKKVCQE